MKVLYLTESLLPHIDGVSLTMARLFGMLAAHGVDFRILSPFVPGADVEWASRVYPMPYVRFPLYPDYRVTLPTARIAAHFDDWGPDLMHVVSPTPFAMRAMRGARRRGVPVVSSFHTHFVSYFRYYRLGALEAAGWRLLRSFYAGCEAVFAPSPAILRELAKQGILHAELWSRGVDTDRFSPLRRDESLRARIPGEGPVILFVGRLVKEKDVGDVVAVSHRLLAQGIAHRMVLVGDGPMRRALQRRLPSACFVGHQQGDALARWYAAADMFFFPSTTETFGNVVLEALASGLPAVVSDWGGPQDLVLDGETGFICPGKDIEAFAGALGWLVANAAPRRAMAARARTLAVGRSWATVNCRLLDAYHRIADPPALTARA